MSILPSYVLITPARNEAQYIDLTLKSVIAQTVLPLRWVIVNDGSCDNTEAIIKRYTADHPWIELISIPETAQRSFAGKVLAFNTGYARVAGLGFEVIASLDADISFDPDYFSFLLAKLAADPALGLVGTPFRENSQEGYDYRFVSLEHVSGACQVFRRECFEAIGGYQPLRGGGIDHLAVISARMQGWKTRTFIEKACQHHRKIGTAQHGTLAARFRYGIKDYAFGNHPLWELCRTAYQMTRKPYVLGGAAIMSGYLWATAKRYQRPLSPDAVRFQRKEQMRRLGRFFAGKSSAATHGNSSPRRA